MNKCKSCQKEYRVFSNTVLEVKKFCKPCLNNKDQLEAFKITEKGSVITTLNVLHVDGFLNRENYEKYLEELSRKIDDSYHKLMKRRNYV